MIYCVVPEELAPELYNRMQASSKTVTLGVLPILLAVVVGESSRPFPGHSSIGCQVSA